MTINLMPTMVNIGKNSDGQNVWVNPQYVMYTREKEVNNALGNTISETRLGDGQYCSSAYTDKSANEIANAINKATSKFNAIA